eukprot:TRINITY_DN101392_c0_g1_i1.p1 TRINITY_DN101392_c0_g1~~TRINITY_DN101392_c0_g1_i1.p1  ORF type:complete len:381 (+),score=64.56 TRINITY_DN101392_c0_g1_i1:65-1144(+)
MMFDHGVVAEHAVSCRAAVTRRLGSTALALQRRRSACGLRIRRHLGFGCRWSAAHAFLLLMGVVAMLSECRDGAAWNAFAAMPGIIDRRPMQQPPYLFTVQFSTAEDAKMAARQLDGKPLQGRKLWVTVDDTEASKTKVNVQGVGSGRGPRQIWDHFKAVGNVIDVRRHRDVMFALVRYQDPDAAWLAKTNLDGSVLRGKKLRLEIDCSDDFLTKILVHGISPRVDFLDLKNHFEKYGLVEQVLIYGGKTATIKYEKSEDAAYAQENLKRTRLLDHPQQALQVMFPWDSRQGGYEIVVKVPKDSTRQQLMRHFGRAGKVESCVIDELKLPPEFYLPTAPMPDPRSFAGGGGVVSAMAER